MFGIACGTASFGLSVPWQHGIAEMCPGGSRRCRIEYRCLFLRTREGRQREVAARGESLILFAAPGWLVGTFGGLQYPPSLAATSGRRSSFVTWIGKVDALAVFLTSHKTRQDLAAMKAGGKWTPPLIPPLSALYHW